MAFLVQQEPEISPLAKSLLETIVAGNQKVAGPMRKSKIDVRFVDPGDFNVFGDGGEGKGEEKPNLVKSILNVLNGPGKDSIERLAFESDPNQNNTYASVYKSKLRLIPDEVLKRMAIQDDLVAAIVNTRAAQLQSFGRPQPDKYSTGFKIIPDEGVLDKMSAEEKESVQKRIDEVQKILVTCGFTKGWADKDRMTFSQWLGMSARNAVTVGRIATEIISITDAQSGEKKFHSFRPIDAGTVYRVSPYQSAAESVRQDALRALENIKNKKLEPERFQKDEYAWVQVINGTPHQALTEDECVVHNFYPVADVELDGYPVTPLDTVMSAVTTHINITTHNRLYFQSGRAARGMIVIESDDVSEETIMRIKHQFQASINNVGNAWRMPVFGVGTGEKITWQAIDANSRDMEFQYLSDTNARVIMSAFQISPEELPGYQHLSRGTNNQALSESNNEYKLQAARDVGIRPLIAQFEDFINQRIMPLLDEKLSKFCVVKFVGLDAETPEKQNVRVKESMDVHMTFDDVLDEFEKTPVGPQFGGNFPLNPLWQQVVDKYMTVGEIRAQFFGDPAAKDNPALAYFRDPFWHQYQAFLMQKQQVEQQAQAQEQAAMAGGQPGGQGAPQQGDPNAQPQQGDPGAQSQQDPNAQQQGGGADLTNGIDQVLGMLTQSSDELMTKSEAQLPAKARRLLAQQRQTTAKLMEHMEEDLAKLTGQILSIAEDHEPEPKKE